MLADVQLLSLSFEHPEVFLELLPDQPSVVEFQRGEYLIAMTRVREFAWFQYQNGILDKPAWEAYLRPLLWLHQIEEVEAWWSEWQRDFDSDFVSHINDRVQSNLMESKRVE